MHWKQEITCSFVVRCCRDPSKIQALSKSCESSSLGIEKSVMSAWMYLRELTRCSYAESFVTSPLPLISSKV